MLPTATLVGANVSLMRLPVGAQISLPHNHLCCGVSQDFVVEEVTRELALRVSIIVHEGYLEAIYLKHRSCGRYPDDVGADETCIGRCQMRWLTTYNQTSALFLYTVSGPNVLNCSSSFAEAAGLMMSAWAARAGASSAGTSPRSTSLSTWPQ